MARNASTRQRKWLVYSIRYGIPILLAAGGTLMIVLGHAHVSDVRDTGSGASVFTQIPTDRDSMFSAIGVGAWLVAAMVAMIGWFARMNFADGDDRRREEAARDYYTRTGRWPGERGSRGSDR
jgi:hypothetical protein